MSTEILLLISIFLFFGAVILLFYLFGKKGLLVWNCIAIIASSIGVIVLVEAFGVSMTLGSVCFASSFLVTDLLCERYSKKDADMTILLSFLVGIIFVLIVQFWMLFTPAQSDEFMPHFEKIFSYTPRIILANLVSYVIVQLIDVRAYYLIWNFTKKINKDERKFLWVRNNFSTIFAQFFNAVLFNIIAFYGVFTDAVLIDVIISTFILYVFTSIVDTPFLYYIRGIKPMNFLDSNNK
ncbi:queuosine precursor transporter [Erysipelotrichaceae bacterium OttesenSCG-928-M19]|nr:queuosine precursor transporter [Erysipelotrichaceae bacterium OttesenSCG-928-M19]